MSVVDEAIQKSCDEGSPRAFDEFMNRAKLEEFKVRVIASEIIIHAGEAKIHTDGKGRGSVCIDGKEFGGHVTGFTLISKVDAIDALTLDCFVLGKVKDPPIIKILDDEEADEN